MAQITYIAETFPEGVDVHLPSGAVVNVRPFQTIDLPDDLAASLCDQAANWAAGVVPAPYAAATGPDASAPVPTPGDAGGPGTAVSDPVSTDDGEEAVNG